MSKERKIKVLDFSNHLLQLKSVSEVLNALEVTVKQNGGQLDLKHPQISGLVDGLSSPTLSTATSCLAVLTSALLKGWLQLPVLMSTLVSQAASVYHYPVVVSAITTVLLWETKVLLHQQDYVCPYLLRINIHPFISVLNSRPECGWCVVSEVKQICQAFDNPIVALKMVEPFIKYILLHPTPSAEISHIGCHLQSELVSMSASSLLCFHHFSEQAKPTTDMLTSLERSKGILNLLVKLIPLQPCKSDQQLVFIAAVLEKVIELALEMKCVDRDDEHHRETQDGLVDMCFSFLCELTERGLPSHSLFTKLSVLCGHKQHQCAPHQWLVLSWLIHQNLLKPQSIVCLLELCTLLFSESGISSSAAKLLAYPLIQLLAQPTTALRPFASQERILSNQKTASTLLNLIERCPSDQLLDAAFTAPLSCSRVYSKLISTLQRFVKIDTQQLEDITASLITNSPESSSSMALVLSALAMLVVQRDDEKLVKAVLNSLEALAKCDPSESPSILSFFLYLQSHTQNPQFKISILYSIPSLATHKLATISIVSTIQALGSTSSLLPLATRLMGKVWQRQDHIFPFLNELLSRVLPPSLPPQLVDEVTLARAIVIRDICKLRAEVHGEQMLSNISKFLLNKESNPLPVAMVIDGLVALCRADVTDVATLWGVLSKPRHSHMKLVDDNRTAVITALCQLFELASEVESETRHANRVFKDSALRYLWNCAFSEDSKVCSAGFRSLSKFPLEDYFLKHMPPKIVTLLGIALPSDSPVPLTGRICVQLLNHIPVECAEAFSCFLANLVEEELKGVQRGVVYGALREAQLPSQTERMLQSVKEALPSLCSANIARDVASVGLIKSTTMLEFEVERRTGRVGKQALRKELDHKLSMLERYIREGTIHSDVSADNVSGWMGLSCLCVSKQWKAFAGKLLDMHCQLRLLDTHSVSVDAESTDPIYVKKKRDAFDWSLLQVLDKLHSFTRSSPDSAPSILLALTGVIANFTAHFSGEDDNIPCMMDLVDGFSAVLLGKQLPVDSSASSLVQTLLRSSHEDFLVAVILSVPELVDGVLTVFWSGVTETVISKLVVLVDGLFEHFHKNPQWYTAVVLNKVLMKTLPIIGRMQEVMSKIIPFLEASAESGSLELLSLTAVLLPSLLLCGSHYSLAKSVLAVLQQKLSSLPDVALSNVSVQLCSVHLANGAVSLYATRELSDEQAMSVVTVLAEMASKAPEAVLLHLSLSVTLNGLGSHGYQHALSLADKIATKWIQEAKELVTIEEGSEVLPVLFGLSGFLGVNLFLDTDTTATVPSNVTFVKTLAPLLFNLLQKFIAHQDNVLCSSSLWLLSQAYLALSCVVKQQEKVPANYSYLADDSTLSNLYLMMKTLSSPPHHPQKRDIQKHLLSSLIICEEAQLPPVNFSAFLIPLLRDKSELEQRIIECLVKFRTQGLRQLASYCASPLIFSTLKVDSKCLLVENMMVLLMSLTLKNVSKFIQLVANVSLNYLQGNDQYFLLKSFLTGLIAAHTNGDVSDEAKICLSENIMCLFADLCGICESTTAALNLRSSVLIKMATCLSNCDPAKVSVMCQVTGGDCVAVRSCISSIMQLCWVKDGVRSCKTLSAVIEWILNNADNPLTVTPLSWLLQTIVECCSTLRKGRETNQNEFIHIMLSWIRETKVVSSRQVDILLLLMDVVCGASNTVVKHCLDVTVNTSVDYGEKFQELLNSPGERHEPLVSQSIRDKVCLFLLDLMKPHQVSKNKLKGQILRLKSVEQFNSPVIWTSIAQWW